MHTDTAERMAVAAADLLALLPAELRREAQLDFADMDDGQRELLRELARVYVGRLPDSVAAVEIEKLEQADWGKALFAWMGAEERGGPHYYSLQGETFLAEYDNTQNDANHIHAVWRHLNADFGADLLSQHYRRSHR